MTINKTPDAFQLSYRFASRGVKDEGGCGLCGLFRPGIENGSGRRAGFREPRRSRGLVETARGRQRAEALSVLGRQCIDLPSFRTARDLRRAAGTFLRLVERLHGCRLC